MSQPQYMSVDGEIVPREKATVHFLSPAAKYGSSVFEGIRGYWNAEQEDMYVFRLDEHVHRLRQSMKVMRFAEDYDEAFLRDVVLETIRANDLREDLHIRLSVLLVGDGLYDSRGPVSLMCAALRSRSRSLEEKAIRAGVSTWRRITDAAMPPRVKCGANYQNSRLGLMEVQAGGYDKVIFLTPEGRVSEGAGECVFVVRNGRILTPPVTAGILESITRETVFEIARETLGISVIEREVDRTELYVADEVFLAGTMAEILPVIEVDNIVVGDGGIGPMARAVWNRLDAICRGSVADHATWRTGVYR